MTQIPTNPRPNKLSRQLVTADPSMPEGVKQLVLAALQECSPRAKANYAPTPHLSYYIAEGGTATVWYQDRALTVTTASENTVCATSLLPGMVQLRPGAWLIETYRFQGVKGVTVIEVTAPALPAGQEA